MCIAFLRQAIEPKDVKEKKKKGSSHTSSPLDSKRKKSRSRSKSPSLKKRSRRSQSSESRSTSRSPARSRSRSPLATSLTVLQHFIIFSNLFSNLSSLACPVTCPPFLIFYQETGLSALWPKRILHPRCWVKIRDFIPTFQIIVTRFLTGSSSFFLVP